jgi:tight adherence protein C
VDRVTAFAFAFALTACYGAALWGAGLLRERGPEERMRPDPPSEDAPTGPRRGPVTRLVDALAGRFGPRAYASMSETRRARVRTRLEAAGRPNGMTVEGYAGRKTAYTMVMCVAGLAFLVQGSVALAVALPLAGFLFLDLWLVVLARRRQFQIDRSLPDFLDILAVTVSAGVAFQPALRRVAEITGGPLGEEIGTALSQMEFGSSRRDAFHAIRERNASESLARFVTALLQAEELGVPLNDTLADLAGDMRRFFYQQARRRAAKAAPRVSLIVTTLILPGAILLILTGFILGSDVDFGALFG